MEGNTVEEHQAVEEQGLEKHEEQLKENKEEQCRVCCPPRCGAKKFGGMDPAKKAAWKQRLFRIFWGARSFFLKYFMSYGVLILRFFTCAVACLFFLVMLVCILDWQNYWLLTLYFFTLINITVNWYHVVNVSANVAKEDAPEWSQKFCYTCKFFRPPRVHHCSFCNACIWRRDHHCFFFGTCVGGQNHGYFILTLFHLLVSVAVITVFGFRYLQDVYRFVGLEWSDILLYPYLYEKLFYTRYRLWVVSCMMLQYGLLIIATVMFGLFAFNIVASLRDVTQQELQYRTLKGPSPTKSLRVVFGQNPFLKLFIPYHKPYDDLMHMLKFPYGTPPPSPEESEYSDSSEGEEEYSSSGSSEGSGSDSWVTDPENEKEEQDGCKKKEIELMG